VVAPLEEKFGIPQMRDY